MAAGGMGWGNTTPPVLGKKRGRIATERPVSKKVEMDPCKLVVNPAESDPTQIGLTMMAKAVFGPTIVDQLKAEGVAARDIWELTDPTTQCRNTIGAFDPTRPDHACWICGLDIDPDGNKKGNGLGPECEHVLPIAQAVLFLQLYNSSFKGSAAELSAGRKKLLDMEYRWAHSVCNQIKSDFSPLIQVPNPVPGGYAMIAGVDKNAIACLFQRILTNDRTDGDAVKKSLAYEESLTGGGYIQERIGAVTKVYSDIANMLSGVNGEGFGLIVLAGAIAATAVESMRPKAAELYDPAAVAAEEARLAEIEKEKQMELAEKQRKLDAVIAQISRYTPENQIDEYETVLTSEYIKLTLKKEMDEIKHTILLSRLGDAFSQAVFGKDLKKDVEYNEWLTAAAANIQAFCTAKMPGLFERLMKGKMTASVVAKLSSDDLIIYTQKKRQESFDEAFSYITNYVMMSLISRVINFVNLSSDIKQAMGESVIGVLPAGVSTPRSYIDNLEKKKLKYSITEPGILEYLAEGNIDPIAQWGVAVKEQDVVETLLKIPALPPISVSNAADVGMGGPGPLAELMSAAAEEDDMGAAAPAGVPNYSNLGGGALRRIRKTRRRQYAHRTVSRSKKTKHLGLRGHRVSKRRIRRTRRIQRQ